MKQTARGEGRARRESRGHPELGRHDRDHAAAAVTTPGRASTASSSRFVVMHSGNVGHAQDLDTLDPRGHASCGTSIELRIVILGFGARHGELTPAGAASRGHGRGAVPRLPAARAPVALALRGRPPLRRARARARGVRRPEPDVRHPRGRPSRARRGGRGLRDGADRARDGVRPRRPARATGAPRAACSATSSRARASLEGMGELGRAWVEREADREIAFDRYRRLLVGAAGEREARSSR